MLRKITKVLALTSAAMLVPLVAAQEFPQDSLTIIAPAAAGGGTDLTARNIAREAEEILGETINVQNMPGGGNAIGISAGYNAEPDGHTMVLGQVETVLLPMMGRVPWEAEDFTPIMGVNSASAALTVRADSPHQTAEEFLTYASENPGVQVGGSAPGTIWHLAAVGLDQAADAGFNVIPYSGGAAPAIQDLLGGQLEAVTVSGGEVSDQVEAGNLRILCLMSEERDTVRFPDVPTCQEEGYDATYATWWALLAPPETPEDIQATLHDAFREAWESDEFQDFLANQGLEPNYVSPEEFPEFISSEKEKFRPVLEELGLLGG